MNSWGSSSSDVWRSRRPIWVTRGILRHLEQWPGTVVELAQLLDALVGVDDHRAELEDRERHAVLARALLAVDDRAGRVEPDRQGDERHQRSAQHDRERGHGTVEEGLGRLPDEVAVRRVEGERQLVADARGPDELDVVVHVGQDQALDLGALQAPGEVTQGRVPEGLVGGDDDAGAAHRAQQLGDVAHDGVHGGAAQRQVRVPRAATDDDQVVAIVPPDGQPVDRVGRSDQQRGDAPHHGAVDQRGRHDQDHRDAQDDDRGPQFGGDDVRDDEDGECAEGQHGQEPLRGAQGAGALVGGQGGEPEAQPHGDSEGDQDQGSGREPDDQAGDDGSEQDDEMADEALADEGGDGGTAGRDGGELAVHGRRSEFSLAGDRLDQSQR